MTRSQKVALLALCLCIAFAQGLIALKLNAGFWILVPGLIGAVPFLLLNGVHGDFEGISGVIGGVLFVLVNGFVYYGIMILLIKWGRKLSR